MSFKQTSKDTKRLNNLISVHKLNWVINGTGLTWFKPELGLNYFQMFEIQVNGDNNHKKVIHPVS